MYDDPRATFDNRTTISDGRAPMDCQAQRGRTEGAALVSALAMLLIFTMLGTAYVRYMVLDNDTAKYQLREVRARHLAIGGINAAIGEIAARLDNDEMPDGSYEFRLPVYVRDGDSMEDRPQEVFVEISDESSRINVNHAPHKVFKALGLESATVRRLKQGLPPQGAQATDERRWLASVQELQLREGFLTAEEYHALDTDLLTVHTVADQTSPAGYMNLNTASPAVLSILFGIPIEESERLAGERPFISWKDVNEKTGRDPQTYNVRPSVRDPNSMPAELSLSSRCFRLESRARIQITAIGDRGVESTVEAVVIFDENGDYRIQFWSKTPSELLEYVPPVKEAAEADEAVDAPSDADGPGLEEASGEVSEAEASEEVQVASEEQ